MKEVSRSKHKTQLFDGIFIGLGIVLLLFGFYIWQSFNSVSGTLMSVFENQGYTIPVSLLITFRQVTLIYVLVTLIGCLFVLVGAVNEATSFFEVK